MSKNKIEDKTISFYWKNRVRDGTYLSFLFAFIFALIPTMILKYFFDVDDDNVIQVVTFVGAYIVWFINFNEMIEVLKGVGVLALILTVIGLVIYGLFGIASLPLNSILLILILVQLSSK